MGHFSKECPKPRDYSKVKCQNCDQSTLAGRLYLSRLHFADEEIVGHTRVRCKEPVKEADDGGFGAGGDNGGFDAPAGGDESAAPSAGGGDSWTVATTDRWAPTPAAATVGGGGQDAW